MSMLKKWKAKVFFECFQELCFTMLLNECERAFYTIKLHPSTLEFLLVTCHIGQIQRTGVDSSMFSSQFMYVCNLDLKIDTLDRLRTLQGLFETIIKRVEYLTPFRQTHVNSEISF